MEASPSPGRSCQLGAAVSLLLFIFTTLIALPGSALADPDVYAALPPDISVLQYDLGDINGDHRKELAVLYTSDGSTRLALFRAESGHWSKWTDGNSSLEREDGATARSILLTDTNGDGTDEILAYYLTSGDTAMVTRVLSLDVKGEGPPALRNILEDRTVPPGYPLLGTEGQKPSVTFLQMNNGSGNGLRRAYCWDGNQFEKCVEVEWKKP